MEKDDEMSVLSRATILQVAGETILGETGKIPVRLTVELGKATITIDQIMQLARGSVVELDGFAGEPLNILVNGHLIAWGEVIVVNERFGIRITDIVAPVEREKKAGPQ